MVFWECEKEGGTVAGWQWALLDRNGIGVWPYTGSSTVVEATNWLTSMLSVQACLRLPHTVLHHHPTGSL